MESSTGRRRPGLPTSSLKSHPTSLSPAGVEYGSRNVLADPEVREGVKRFTAWPTIPQIFIKGEFVVSACCAVLWCGVRGAQGGY